MTSNHRKKWPTIYIVIIVLLILNIIGFSIYFYMDQVQGTKSTNEAQEQNSQNTSYENNSTIESVEKNKEKVEIKEPINIQIAAAGDIMVHSTQITSAYDSQSKTYDFKPFFKDVKPILSGADLTIANFETTTAGPKREYTGYPQFNSPDEIVDAIKDAGVDVLTTVNNHSLDTGSDGLKRTVKTIQERGIDTVGNYATKPDSRVLIKEVEGIKLALDRKSVV